MSIRGSCFVKLLRARPFAFALFTFPFEALALRFGRRFRRFAGFARALQLFELLGHSFISRVAIGRLRSPFGRGDDEAEHVVAAPHRSEASQRPRHRLAQGGENAQGSPLEVGQGQSKVAVGQVGGEPDRAVAGVVVGRADGGVDADV